MHSILSRYSREMRSPLLPARILVLPVWFMMVLPCSPADEPKGGTLRGHSAYVWCVAFSPDGKTLASGGHDRTVKLWDVATKKERAAFDNQGQSTTTLAFSPDGKTVALAGTDRTVRLLDAANGKELDRFDGHTGTVWDVAFAPDGKSVFSAGDDTIRRWSRGNKNALDTFNHGAAVRSIAVGPDGKTFASAGGPEVKLWNVEEGKIYSTLPPCSSICYFPDGKLLIGNTYIEKQFEATIWDLGTKKTTSTIKSTWTGLYLLRLNSNGKYLATSSARNEGREQVMEVKLFEVASGKELATLHRTPGIRPFLGVAFSPDSSTLAVGNDDGTISLLNITKYTQGQK